MAFCDVNELSVFERASIIRTFFQEDGTRNALSILKHKTPLQSLRYFEAQKTSLIGLGGRVGAASLHGRPRGQSQLGGLRMQRRTPTEALSAAGSLLPTGEHLWAFKKDQISRLYVFFPPKKVKQDQKRHKGIRWYNYFPLLLNPLRFIGTLSKPLWFTSLSKNHHQKPATLENQFIDVWSMSLNQKHQKQFFKRTCFGGSCFLAPQPLFGSWRSDKKAMKAGGVSGFLVGVPGSIFSRIFQVFLFYYLYQAFPSIKGGFCFGRQYWERTM